VHNTTDINKKRGETARAMSGTAQQSAHTAMDHALKAQEVNTELLLRTSRAWIEGFRYQAQLSQGMARVFFGQWGNAFARMPRVELPAQEHSSRGSEVTEGATNGGARKATEPAAEDDAQKKKKAEIAAKDAQKKKAEKEAEDAKEAREAEDTRKAEKVAQETQEATETAAKSAQESTEPGAQETQKSTEVAAKDAQETQKSTEVAARDARESAEKASFPIEGYDEMNKGEVSERLDGLSAEELKRVRRYEKHNKDRGSLRKEMKQKINTQRDEAEDETTS
jgi:hypothetical protein